MLLFLIAAGAMMLVRVLPTIAHVMESIAKR
jgi:hypothetical protein